MKYRVLLAVACVCTLASGSPLRAQSLDAIRYTLRFPAPHTHYVEPFAGGFRIRQGGGSLNFAPVPEPSSTAMLLCGLAAAGFLGYRRQRKQG